MSEASDGKSGPTDAFTMVRHRSRCRNALPLLHLWPNEPKSVHLDILDRRSNRRLSWEKLLASGSENVTDLWGYGLVKSTSYTSQSHSCFGSWGPCRWSFWASKSTNALVPKRHIACGKWCNTGTAMYNYSHSGLPQLICDWTPHPTIFFQIGTKEY